MGDEEEKKSLGTSLLVPSVKELAKDCLSTIPERYVVNNESTDQDRPISNHDDDDDDLQVPIINLEGLISGDEKEINNLHLACQQWGFFQLVNHGVESSIVEKFKSETQEFFNLPLEEKKKKYWQTSTNVEGFGQIFVVSGDQKLDWADVFFLTTLPKHRRKSNLASILPLPYRETLESYSIELQSLAKKILDSMAKALNVDLEGMRGVFGEGAQSMRMNYYPPCPHPDKVIGLTPHSDSVALTILLQLNEMEGLQIWKDEKWVPIKPLKDAFVVNVGDILEIVSNGIYRSVLHRAVVNSSKERLSVATFYSPAEDCEIEPLPDLVTPLTPAKFKHINTADYWKGYFSRALDGKSYLDLMKTN